ncbi:tetratricopeptide repeat protein [Desulfohalovibrio reitneri]|uniref:tetratricopeptide repeat protein n=1 Tax=Desulfohalovibrio reitneri TaxID=1307759 RepID=UPI0004A6D67B|nr:tetratricopeptide repeat protein [Desulfohalovibrio reitneri]
MFFIAAGENDSFQYKDSGRAETKSLYVIRTDDEIVHKHARPIEEFVEDGGLFLVVSDDRLFYRNCKIALVNELGLRHADVCCCPTIGQARERVEQLRREGGTPFIFLETRLDEESPLEFMREVQSGVTGAKVAVLAAEVNQSQLFLFHEKGADGLVLKPAGPNAIIQKAAFVLNPQSELEELIAEGKRLIGKEEFEAAINVARAVLARKPGSPAGLLIMGDALKGMRKREEALRAYKTASDNAKLFLEPLKRIVQFHLEDNNEREMLTYLVKLDHLSPLNLDRKVEIGGIHLRHGEEEKAQRYFDKAVSFAGMEGASSVACEMSMSIGAMLLDERPDLALKYFRNSLRLSKGSSRSYQMATFNRIGIALRQKGMWEESVEAYLEAEEIAPDDENIQYNICLAYYDGGEYAKALERLEKALRINPDFHGDDASILYSVAHIYMKARRKDRALECLNRILDIHGGYKETRALAAKLRRGEEPK